MTQDAPKPLPFSLTPRVERLTDDAALALAEKYIDEDLQRFIDLGAPLYRAP